LFKSETGRVVRERRGDRKVQELRSVEDIPILDHSAMDYKMPWKSSSNMKERKYYRHDAEAMFYLWFAIARRVKSYYYPSMPSGDRKSWFWSHPDALQHCSRLSDGSESTEEVWMALWKFVGEAHFLSRMDPKHETLGGNFTPEKLLEAIGVDAESLASTAADDESTKEYVSDPD
jgi:hypothetical protein